MARKSRKAKAKRPLRPPAAVAAPAQVAGASAPRAASPRPVELTLGARPAAARRPGRIVIESTDPGIPLDRVPYFTGDLARLGITVGAMLVLLVAGAQLIPLVIR